MRQPRSSAADLSQHEAGVTRCMWLCGRAPTCGGRRPTRPWRSTRTRATCSSSSVRLRARRQHFFLGGARARARACCVPSNVRGFQHSVLQVMLALDVLTWRRA